MAPSGSLDDLVADSRFTAQERVVPSTTDAPDVTLLILSPTGFTGPRPVIYYIHGGGMVLGDRYTGIELVAPFAANHGAIIVSVEYRLSPEHPHPAPIDDCYAGLVWTAEHADEFHADPHQISVLGISAGGGLAAGITLMARDRSGPAITHQILWSPMLDDRELTPSSVDFTGEGSWHRENNRFAWAALLGDAVRSDTVSPYAAPARAVDLSGLPPAFIDVGNAEPFRDPAIDYAARLSQAGIQVEFHMWPGGVHTFELMVPDAPISVGNRHARHAYVERMLA
nr:alpha/beta hydrolase [Kineosporia babensis]